jgi:hypothetical protein
MHIRIDINHELGEMADQWKKNYLIYKLGLQASELDSGTI